MVFIGTALKGWREPYISNCSFVTGKGMVMSHLYTLLFIGLFCVDWASAKIKKQVWAGELDAELANLESELNKCINANCTVEALLHLIRDDIFDLRVDQELMKEDLVNRLEAIKNTDLTSQIEHILANHYRDFRPSRNFSKVHTSCEAAFNAGWTRSGVYRVSPEGSNVTIDVYCKQESELFGGGWTVFQRRIDGSLDFYRTWDQYKNGFGDLNAEFWLGNDNIHKLTADRHQMLKVELEHYGSGFAYATYAAFWVNSAVHKYQLHVSDFSAGDPNPGDALSYNSGRFFTTKDRDNDISNESCAKHDMGAWWYGICTYANLNGLYGSTEREKGIVWYQWKGNTSPMKSVRMMIKTVNEKLLEDIEEGPY